MPTAVQDARDLIDRAARRAGSERARLELLRELTDLTAYVAAVQAEVAVGFERDVLARRAAEGVAARDRGVGIVSEVGIARRESPHRAAHLLGLARALMGEMPHTLSAMRAGVISEYRAAVIARETACLAADDRRSLDRELCGDRDRIATWGTRRLGDEARRLAHRLDPRAATARAARAREQRHTGLRPAPDTMSWFGALLPVEQGVAMHATLRRLADAAVAAGDGRSRGQLMADGLVETVTGLDLGVLRRQQDPTVWARPGSDLAPDARVLIRDAVPVAVGLTVSDQTLLAGGSEPGWLADYGPIPAPLARDLVRRAESQARAALRRLYVDAGGAVVAMDSRARLFPRGLARLVAARDRSCRTPWCDAPLRHIDHVVPHAQGGPTSLDNGQGLCARCNLAKQAPGWDSRPAPPGHPNEVVEVRTPHGLRELSRAPTAPPPLRPWARLDVFHGREVALADSAA